MLHIILLILKITGIILLVILGLLLAIALIVLLVPLRYKGQGAFYGKPEGRVTVSWLCHIISVTVSCYEQMDVVIRLFGFRILKGGKQTAETGEEAEVKSAVRAGAGDFAEEPMVSIQELGNNEWEEAESEPGISIQDSEPEKRRASGQKENIFLRIAGRIRRIIRHLMLSFERFCEKLKQAEHLKEEAAAFLNDEKNKKTFHLILRQMKKILRHLLPRKLKGQIVFGCEDPYLMGQILSGAAFFYPLYHNSFLLEPVFDRQIIEGKIALRGRIRFGVFLIAGLKILLNRNFRTQLKRFLNRGGM